MIALYTFCFTFFVGSLACFHLFLITQGLTTYLWFKQYNDMLDEPVDLRGGDATGFRQCARSTRAVARPFTDSSGGYVRWRRSFRTTPENEMGVSELEVASKPWSFRDLYDDAVRPSSSYSADEQPRPLDSDAASAAAQMEAFAASGVAAAVAVAAQGGENRRKTGMAAKEPDHVSDVEAPALVPTHSLVAGEDDAADDGTAVDKETEDSPGPPATVQRQPPTEDLRNDAEEEQEDARQDEARP